MDKPDLIAEVIKLDRQAHRLIRRHSFDAWMNLNLTNAQLRSLFFIWHRPGTNPGKLASALGTTPPNVTGVIDRLVEQGLVSRHDSPDDRRAHVLQVTEKGESILSDLRERRTSSMHRILVGLEPDELSALAKGLGALVRAARVYEEDQDEHNPGREP